MGGQAAVTEVLLTVFIMAALAVSFMLLPKTIQEMIKMLSLASAEVVARDLAGLISVSGTAPGRIYINYDPPGDVRYDVWIEGRVVNVKAGEKPEVGSAKIWVEFDATLEDVTRFNLTKSEVDEYFLEGR